MDDKWFYVEQKLQTATGAAAITLSKALVRDKSETVSPSLVLEAADIYRAPPVRTEALARWLLAEEMLHEEEHLE